VTSDYFLLLLLRTSQTDGESGIAEYPASRLGDYGLKGGEFCFFVHEVYGLDDRFR
jgi:hypothetical protein